MINAMNLFRIGFVYAYLWFVSFSSNSARVMEGAREGFFLVNAVGMTAVVTLFEYENDAHWLILFLGELNEMNDIFIDDWEYGFVFMRILASTGNARKTFYGSHKEKEEG